MQYLISLDFNVVNLALSATQRLMDHNARIGQSIPAEGKHKRPPISALL